MTVPTSRPNPKIWEGRRAAAERHRKKREETEAAARTAWLAAQESLSSVVEPHPLAPLLEVMGELVANQREILDVYARLRRLARAARTFRDGPSPSAEVCADLSFLSTLIDMLAVVEAAS